MLKIKIKNKIQEAEGDSEQLVGLNMDYLKKNNPKKPEQNPREYYTGLQTQAKSGVDQMFSKEIIDILEKLPDQFLPKDGRKYFTKWLGNVLKDGERPNNEEIRLVKDYFVGNNAPQLPSKFSDVLNVSRQWHDQLGQSSNQPSGDYKTNDVVYEFGNGYKMVRISAASGDEKSVVHDLRTEGKKMQNCVGKVHCKQITSAEETIFSLRDSKTNHMLQ